MQIIKLPAWNKKWDKLEDFVLTMFAIILVGLLCEMCYRDGLAAGMAAAEAEADKVAKAADRALKIGREAGKREVVLECYKSDGRVTEQRAGEEEK